MSQPTNIPKPSPVSAEASIRQLIASGKCKAALDGAKEYHKSQGTAASEGLLVDAYAARIRVLFEQNLDPEAKSLLELVRQRFPAAGAVWDELSSASALRSGSLDELLQPLSDPAIGAERRAAVEQAIRHRVSDLAGLAACTALPEGHSLRVAAAALDRAFLAVTSGPVSDEQLTLPEVSHRSPLSAWKLLVRAIASFHRGEDEKCGEYLDAIPAESVPARLAAPMRALLGAKGDSLTPAAAALVARFGDKSAALKKALEQVERAFAEEDTSGPIFKAVRAAIQEARKPGQTTPDQLERLKRHIYARGVMNDLVEERLSAALEGAPRKGAELSRLLARGLELTSEEMNLMLAVRIWAEFVKEGVREKWFPAGGIEEASLYLHMAELTGQISRDTLRDVQRSARAESRALSEGSGEDTYFYYPEKLFERACALDPHAEAFSKWMHQAAERSPAQAESVAKNGTRPARRTSSLLFF